MNISDLANKLAEMVDNAPDRDKVAMIHLFGIKYGKIILEKDISPNEIVKITKLKDGSMFNYSYKTELSKGIKLSKYVIDKKEIIDYIKNK